MKLAQVDIGQDYAPAKNFTTLGDLVSSFLPNFLLLAGVLFFVLIVIAGIGVVAGAGSDNPHAQEKAKAFLTYAVIGLVLIFASYWIVQIISYITFDSLKGRI